MLLWAYKGINSIRSHFFALYRCKKIALRGNDGKFREWLNLTIFMIRKEAKDGDNIILP